MSATYESPFALGEPCAQSKDGELLWDFETIAKAVSDAVAAERARCADIARKGVQLLGYDLCADRIAKAVMEDKA